MTARREAGYRLRRRRLAAMAASITVTGVAVLGGAGMLPLATAGTVTPAARAMAVGGAVAGSGSGRVPDPVAESAPATVGGDHLDAAGTGPRVRETALPARSGSGRRVVFSESRQRVWLVGRDGTVIHSYLVSGSVYDNLDPGRYEVYSRSPLAWGLDDTGTMRYFVRFARGDRAAIGFHDIPIDDGRPVQTLAELGTPQSHGCIRQRHSDARLLWRFAPLGTPVVVTA